ncbi:SGNH/GDSL hydrolase family protein [Paucibacter sp. Y2R2-4]|uniref:SGNH/GDSL hydrolase family protein n=1 Tax=Paucibacter sp. Y2R2-4 TaxID=2893553 RepID=UPI0021E4ACB8|nr:SGNH/GDSL hydrolase family protein [Paucibacter sp. Y2R2-4]MCV2348797.1 PEP-CTERM sorting domain-containing protein [Paucibacter sp. Y2R2-4]
MHHFLHHRALRTTLLCAGLAFTAHSATAASYSQLIAFGDSLSDKGNFFQATGGTVPQPSDYYQGRFSNGPVAVEHLAQGLGVGLNDYAYGGAMSGLLNGAVEASGQGGPLLQTGVLSQIASFQSGLGAASADANALYFVWAGANDFQYHGYTSSTAQTALQNLSTSVSTLYSLGARNFLLPGLPDLGLTPGGLTSGGSALLHQLSLSYNQGLKANIEQLRILPGAQISFFDTLAEQQALVDNPANYGLSNVKDACFSGYVGVAGNTCSSPESYMYWDRVHPSAVTHQILGQSMLAAVPEPQTLLLMAVGVLALLARGGGKKRMSA